MPGIINSPDREYDIMEVRERFEIPGELVEKISQTVDPRVKYLLIQTYIYKQAYEAAKLAAWKYERLRHWKFRPDLGVVVDKSELQVDLTSLGFHDDGTLTSQLDGDLLNSRRGNVAYVVKMKFQVEKVRTYVPSPEELNEDDGFVEEMDYTPGKIVEVD